MDTSYSKLEKMIADRLESYPIEVLYIFGSFASGKAGKLSDLDIGLLLSSTLSASERFDLRLELSNRLSSTTARRVDIVVLNDAPPTLANEVIANGKLVFCRDEDVRSPSKLRRCRPIWIDGSTKSEELA
ncbi:MAG: nucleotidyltransferase domain-containing protein [Proteobacteria bacterium]|nr:nucleotidyltransferase domain-containing protein [Pseudomonadota bacterium]